MTSFFWNWSEFISKATW